MKVVFLEDVPSVARAGEVKEVADGYGRNYLLPRKLAALATTAQLKRLEQEHQALARHQAHTEEEAQEMATRLQGVTLVFRAKVGAKERLYGSITSADIVDEIRKVTGYEVDKRRVEMEGPIRELGTYEVPLKLTRDVATTVRVEVQEQQAE